MLTSHISKRFIQSVASLPNIGAAVIDSGVMGNDRSHSDLETKPFEAIPKVKGLPFLGTALEYTKDQFKGRPFEMPAHRYQEYGKIYREKPIPNAPEFVVTLNPADVEAVFRADGTEPHRPTFSVFDEARKKAKQERGLVLSQGKDWTSLRRPISKYMLTPAVVQKFVPDFNDISRDLVDYVRRHKSGSSGAMTLQDSAASLFKLTHECISQFMLGERPNLLKEDFQSEHKQVVDSIQDFLRLAGELLFEVPLYMVYPTKKWKVAVKAQNKAINEITELVVNRMEQLVTDEGDVAEAGNSSSSSNLLLHMLGTGSMNTTSIIHNTVSLLVAGIDSTSYTLLFTLHCLAQNPHIQEDLRKEIEAVQNGKDSLDASDLGKMKLLSSCIREAQRLYPAAPFNARLTKKDLVLSGHHVPSGSTVLMPFYAMGRMKEYFENPEVYDPYRWMREGKKNVEKFASMPFGFGARMCIGKRVADMQLKMSTAYLLKNFNVASTSDFNIVQNVFLNADRQVPITFTEVGSN